MKYFTSLFATAFVVFTLSPTVEASANLWQAAEFWPKRALYYKQNVFFIALVNSLQGTTDETGGDDATATSASDSSDSTAAAAASTCIDSLNNFMGITQQLQATIISDASYYTSLAAKGNGKGTNFGFQMSKMSKYSNLVVAGFNFYNLCKIDYYTQALGFNFQSTSGILNFGTNVYWRITSGETTVDSLLSGITNNNPYTVGHYLGIYIRDMLAVELPDVNDNSLQYYQTTTV